MLSYYFNGHIESLNATCTCMQFISITHNYCISTEYGNKIGEIHYCKISLKNPVMTEYTSNLKVALNV